MLASLHANSNDPDDYLSIMLRHDDSNPADPTPTSGGASPRPSPLGKAARARRKREKQAHLKVSKQGQVRVTPKKSQKSWVVKPTTAAVPKVSQPPVPETPVPETPPTETPVKSKAVYSCEAMEKLNKAIPDRKRHNLSSSDYVILHSVDGMCVPYTGDSKAVAKELAFSNLYPATDASNSAIKVHLAYSSDRGWFVPPKACLKRIYHGRSGMRLLAHLPDGNRVLQRDSATGEEVVTCYWDDYYFASTCPTHVAPEAANTEPVRLTGAEQVGGPAPGAGADEQSTKSASAAKSASTTKSKGKSKSRTSGSPGAKSGAKEGTKDKPKGAGGRITVQRDKVAAPTYSPEFHSSHDSVVFSTLEGINLIKDKEKAAGAGEDAPTPGGEDTQEETAREASKAQARARRRERERERMRQAVLLQEPTPDIRDHAPAICPDEQDAYTPSDAHTSNPMVSSLTGARYPTADIREEMDTYKACCRNHIRRGMYDRGRILDAAPLPEDHIEPLVYWLEDIASSHFATANGKDTPGALLQLTCPEDIAKLMHMDTLMMYPVSREAAFTQIRSNPHVAQTLKNFYMLEFRKFIARKLKASAERERAAGGTRGTKRRRRSLTAGTGADGAAAEPKKKKARSASRGSSGGSKTAGDSSKPQS